MKQFPVFIIAFILVTILMTIHNNKPEETPKVEETEEPIIMNPKYLICEGDTLIVLLEGNKIQIRPLHHPSVKNILQNLKRK